MKNISLKKILKRRRALYLAYDQGLEHGPSDFNDINVDPRRIIKIAADGKFNAVVFQKGIIEKYHQEIRASKVPLIIKLNGKTNLSQGEPISRQLCSVKEAVALKGVAVGYTIYVGSEHETEMMTEFERIEHEAHEAGLPVIAWVYPRGKGIRNRTSRELLAYATRVGLELGADIVKVNWNGNQNDLRWAVKAAGKTKVVVAGGIKSDEKTFLKNVHTIMETGACGLAVGRNIWQHKQPLELTRKIRKIIFDTAN